MNTVPHPIIKRKPTISRDMRSYKNSDCDTSWLSDLDWTNWYQDHSFGSHYIHVRSSLTEHGDETHHRVYPKKIRGYTCTRIGMKDGNPHWLHDHTATKKAQQ